MTTKHSAYELDVRLREIAPPIWRTVEVPGTATLEDVHYAIQLAMGWTNSHLHQFKIGKRIYGMTGVEEFEKMEDERAYALQDVAKKGATFDYEYDFGDGWEHEVTVTRVSPSAKPVRPRCLAGGRACPPEDCGGPLGYEQLLEVLADPKHKQHDELSAWAPANFASERYVVSTKDLTREIEALRALADQGRDDGDDAGDAEDDGLGALPPLLVEAALSLAPMQRASLVALLAGSLADQLLTAVNMIEQANRAATVTTRKHTNSGPRRRPK